MVRINDPLSGSDLLSRKLLEVSIHIGSNSNRSSEVDRRDFEHVEIEITQGVLIPGQISKEEIQLLLMFCTNLPYFCLDSLAKDGGMIRQLDWINICTASV